MSDNKNSIGIFDRLFQDSTYNKLCIILALAMVYFAGKRFEEEKYVNCIVNIVVSLIIIINSSYRLFHNRKPLSQTVNYLGVKLDK